MNMQNSHSKQMQISLSKTQNLFQQDHRFEKILRNIFPENSRNLQNLFTHIITSS